MMKCARSNSANDKGRCPASSRGRFRAPSVVTQRKPFSKLNVRAALKIGTCNVRTVLEPDCARLLIDELEAAHVAIMGLQEMRWSDSGEIAVGNYHLLWSGPEKRNPVKAE